MCFAVARQSQCADNISSLTRSRRSLTENSSFHKLNWMTGRGVEDELKY